MGKIKYKIIVVFLVFSNITSFSQVCGFNEEISDDVVSYVERLCGGYAIPENKSNYDINYNPHKAQRENKGSDLTDKEEFELNRLAFLHRGAVEVVNKIVESYGVRGRFILQPCESVYNAYALTENGIRYILYDDEFMNDIEYGFGNTYKNKDKITENTYINLFILAHEIAHHIQGHTLNAVDYIPNSDKKIIELEADSWAGFVMQRLGLSIEQASMAINKIVPEEKDDTNLRYPSKSKRLKAIEEGFDNSIGQKSDFELKNNHRNYYLEGQDKYYEGDYYGAIEKYTLAINLVTKSQFEISGLDSEIAKDYQYSGTSNDRGMFHADYLIKYYISRAKAWRELGDYEKALSDYNLINEKVGGINAIALYERGIVYRLMEKFWPSYKDLEMAIIHLGWGIEAFDKDKSTSSPFAIHLTFQQALLYKTDYHFDYAKSYMLIDETEYQKSLDSLAVVWKEDGIKRGWGDDYVPSIRRETAKERGVEEFKKLISFITNFDDKYSNVEEVESISILDNRYNGIPDLWIQDLFLSYWELIYYYQYLDNEKSESYINEFIDLIEYVISENRDDFLIDEYIDEEYLRILEKKSQIEAENSDFNSAIKTAKKLITYFPEHIAGYGMLFGIYNSIENYNEALNVANDVIKLYEKYFPEIILKDYAVAYHIRGDLLNYKFNDSTNSLKDYNSAIEIDSTENNFYFSRINLFIKTGNYNKAEEDIRKMQLVSPNDPDSYYKLAYIQQKKGNSYAAWEQISFAINNMKNYSEEYFILNIEGNLVELSDLYLFRAQTQKEIGNNSGLCNDLKIAFELIKNSDSQKISKINELLKDNCN